MINLLFKRPEQIVKAIHADIDSAEDRLLASADKFLSSINVEKESDLESMATRLNNLGFTGTETARKYNHFLKGQAKLGEQLIKIGGFAELIRYYKQNYPFQKFLTEEELNRICDKYGLIYAPVAHYLYDVPEKNLRDIEHAKPLDDAHVEPDEIRLYIKCKLTGGTRKERRHIRKNGVVLPPGQSIGNVYSTPALHYAGYDIDAEYDTIYREFHTIKKEGLFIAAPKKHFNLKGLRGMNKFSFSSVSVFKQKDPIVFRYCKGGIQVLTKWGLEAEDKALLNEKLN